MLFRFSMVFEIASAVVCICFLYGRKMGCDISTIALMIGCIFITDIVNTYGLSSCFMLVVYGLIGAFCVYKFKDSVLGAVLSVILMLIILVSVQFFYTLLLDLLFDVGEALRALLTNILVLGSCFWILPQCRLAVLRKSIKKYRSFLLPVIMFTAFIVFALQFQQRIFGQMYSELFVLAVPAVLLLLLLIVKWVTVQGEKQEAEKELFMTRSMQHKYEDLLRIVRLQQHGYKNHLSAVLATHYTYKTYDKLVKAQREYCQKIATENRYNDLLVLGNTVLTGFLYEKFQSVEEEDISLEYEIKGKLLLDGLSVSVYYLVEMLGILLDNAVQAVRQGNVKKSVRFCFYEGMEEYQILIGNPFPYTSYDVIETWFRMGGSTKGEGRGLGLYYLKCLCEKWNCGIICKNTEIGTENWIEFILEMRKADKG